MVSIPRGLHYQTSEPVLKKLAAFGDAGLDKVHVVSDFDLTLTAGKKRGDNLCTWDVMDVLMPPEGVAAHAVIYQSFRPIEIDGKLTDTVAQEKWTDLLDLITSYRMSIDDIKAAFLSVAALRTGAKKLFNMCKDNAVPTVILSSGIKNVIDIMAEHYSLQPDYILSNDLVVDDNGYVSGWRRDNLIHVLNKHAMCNDELSALRTRHPYVLLLGDVPADAKMVPGDDTVIRIRVLDPRKGEEHHLEAALHESFAAGYDFVTEHSLQPVVEIVQQLLATASFQ